MSGFVKKLTKIEHIRRGQNNTHFDIKHARRITLNSAQLCDMRAWHYAIFSDEGFCTTNGNLSLFLLHSHTGCEPVTFSRVKRVCLRPPLRSCNTILFNDNPCPCQPQSAGNVFLNLYLSGRGLWVSYSFGVQKANIYSVRYSNIAVLVVNQIQLGISKCVDYIHTWMEFSHAGWHLVLLSFSLPQSIAFSLNCEG